MADTAKPLPRGTYIELIRSLFATRFTTAIMALSFVAVGIVIDLQIRDTLLGILIVAGVIAAGGRLFVLVAYGRQARDPQLDFAGARDLERVFAVPYLLFAAVFGAFSARAFAVATADAHVLVVGLVFGYAAGVAAGISYRLWISVTAVMLAVVPTALVALFSANPTYWAVAALFCIFLGGGIHSMVCRYHYAAAGIEMGQVFERLARRDALTGLANRLALREQFGAIAARQPLIAVHCLDLDRFKPVNDTLGHPIGDQVLKAVAQRLSGLLRDGDVAARTGGDEFVVVQADLSHPGEAELLAARVRRALGEPFSVEGHSIQIGASVGYAVSSRHGYDLDRLISCADSALLSAKASGRGIAAYSELSPVEARWAG